MMVISIVVAVLGMVLKVLGKKLEEVEISGRIYWEKNSLVIIIIIKSKSKVGDHNQRCTWRLPFQ